MEKLIAALGDPRCPLLINREAFGFRTVGPDWAIPPRRLSEHLLYFIVAGAHTGRVDGKPLAVGPETLLWLRPGTPHYFRLAAGEKSMTLYHLRFRLLQRGRDVTTRTGMFMLENLSTVRLFLQAIVDELQVELPCNQERIRALLRLVCIEAWRRRVAPALAGTQLSLWQRQRLVAFLRQNARRRIGTSELAAQARLSADYFARVFRRTFGISPRSWLMRERIRLAAQRLLESSLNVSEVALEFGYRDVFLFSRQFKQVVGRSPRNYRRPAGR